MSLEDIQVNEVKRTSSLIAEPSPAQLYRLSRLLTGQEFDGSIIKAYLLVFTLLLIPD
jgi:hypothetical protein